MVRNSWSVILLAACGGGSTTPNQHKDAAVDAPHVIVDSPLLDAPADTSNIDDAPTDTVIGDAFVPDAQTQTLLTVKNYISWCTVSIAGGTTSTAGVQTVAVTPGTVTLVAKPANTAFALGPNMWHHTTGDLGTGDSGVQAGSGTAATSTTSALVVAATTKCVWVCCPFTNGTGCENTIPDQCP